jgi:tRNA-modifying protein YgfZ
MNTNWKDFLLNQKAIASGDHLSVVDTNNIGDKAIYPLNHLAVLVVSGTNAATLLQGQMTCNVNDVSETKSSLTAICNHKGRVIATFLLVKKAETFLLILPIELLETVKTRLQMYVLRSQVNILDGSDEYCLLGLCEPGQPAKAFFTEANENTIAVSFPGSFNRKLLIADAANAICLWSEKTDSQGFRKSTSNEWCYLDIISGIPWVSKTTSEEFIPQMLNLDKLGGISFNKGCYTGQEIVARTHYLGKAKREMFLAEGQCSTPPEPNASIINRNSEDQEIVGKVLRTQQTKHKCLMLVILQTGDTTYENIGLQDDKQSQIKVIPFAYD